MTEHVHNRGHWVLLHFDEEITNNLILRLRTPESRVYRFNEDIPESTRREIISRNNDIVVVDRPHRDSKFWRRMFQFSSLKIRIIIRAENLLNFSPAMRQNIRYLHLHNPDEKMKNELEKKYFWFCNFDKVKYPEDKYVVLSLRTNVKCV